jgi:hypothetical protein
MQAPAVLASDPQAPVGLIQVRPDPHQRMQFTPFNDNLTLARCTGSHELLRPTKATMSMKTHERQIAGT